MATMIPAIWILEMEMFKLRAGDLTQSTAASTVFPTPTASSNTTSNGQVCTLYNPEYSHIFNILPGWFESIPRLSNSQGFMILVVIVQLCGLTS